jgi:hypothetical protein
VECTGREGVAAYAVDALGVEPAHVDLAGADADDLRELAIRKPAVRRGVGDADTSDEV